jgi:hypothetical protein
LEGSDYDTFQIILYISLDGVNYNKKNLSWNSRYPGRGSSQAPPEYEFTAVPLHKSSRLFQYMRFILRKKKNVVGVLL